MNSQIQVLRAAVDVLEEQVGWLARMILHMHDCPKEGPGFAECLTEICFMVDDEIPEDLTAQEDEEGTEEEDLQVEPAELKAVAVIAEEVFGPGLSDSPGKANILNPTAKPTKRRVPRLNKGA